MTTIPILGLTRYSRLGPSSRLRTFQYADILREYGLSLRLAPFFDDAYLRRRFAGTSRFGPQILRYYLRRLRAMQRPEDAALLWIEKEALPWVPWLLERRALPRHLAYVVDYDDATFHRYDRHRLAPVRRLLGQKIDRVMQGAALVTAGNPYLAARAEETGAARVALLPTVIDLRRYPVAPKPARSEADGPVTIGWIGSPQTRAMLTPFEPAFRAVAAEANVRFVAIGARPDQLHGTPFTAWRWSEEEEVTLLLQCDIGIMPLPDTAWTRGKCGYKLIQYMACGLPVVASPVGVNASLIRPGIHGLLPRTQPEWVEALRELIDAPAKRQAMGQAGRVRVAEHYTVQAQGPRLAELLREAGTAAAR